MREAYRKHPDSMLDADDWSTAETCHRPQAGDPCCY
jgi:hypothetical protein